MTFPLGVYSLVTLGLARSRAAFAFQAGDGFAWLALLGEGEGAGESISAATRSCTKPCQC